eukprot:EST41899.1 Copine I [Spironucleus salmonicida]
MGCGQPKINMNYGSFEELLTEIKSKDFQSVFYLDFARIDNFAKQHIYTQIIQNLAAILHIFDADQIYPVFRFDDAVYPLRFPDFKNYMFAGEYRVIEEVENAVKTISGKQESTLDCVLDHAIEQSEQSPNQHLIMMVLISDFCEVTSLTHSKLVKCSSFPVSFIICGSGAGSYKKFISLDVMRTRIFDNLHFVDYGKIQYQMGYYNLLSEEEKTKLTQRDFLVEFFREVPTQRKLIDELGMLQ